MVERWAVVTIGNLSRNCFWGEDDATPRRPAIATCTLVSGPDFCLLVDPSLADRDAMAAELDRRSGLPLTAITHAFVTHGHGDHWRGLAHLTEAEWYAAPEVADGLNETGQLPRRVHRASGDLLPGVEMLPTPGHTLCHHSLAFACSGERVVVAGDAVMTVDSCRERRGYLNTVDTEQARQTMDHLAARADALVPGHDNWFRVR